MQNEDWPVQSAPERILNRTGSSRTPELVDEVDPRSTSALDDGFIE